MDVEKKKRKMEEAAADEEEDKMEKFFALIKSTREVRERLVAAPESRERAAAEKRPWNPTFVLEDFVEASPPPPEVEKEGTSAEGQKQESVEKSGKKGLDLDLNLSL